MPELPEVETVKNGLLKSIAKATIDDVWLSSKKLRFPIAPKNFKKVIGLPILKIERRAKYLLFDLGDVILLNHLGMTGTWREWKEDTLHDHAKIKLSNGKILVYNDPRRFGFFSVFNKKDILKNQFLKHLGPEPFADDFSAEYLLAKTKNKVAPLKNFIMDQKVVVGVGNIYASEALYMSKIKPTRQAKKLKRPEAEDLVQNIRKVLQSAIEAGGSYIRDFKGLDGTASFQMHFQVYDKSGKPCQHCKKPIQKIVQAGRSTYFCKNCQK
jgi:formamidopyrimidine-DNA glycosylase